MCAVFIGRLRASITAASAAIEHTHTHTQRATHTHTHTEGGRRAGHTAVAAARADATGAMRDSDVAAHIL